MLRIEQGVDESLFTTTDLRLASYAKHHSLVLPSIAAYDLKARDIEHQTMRQRFAKVCDGLERSATLCLVLENVQDSADSFEWNELKEIFAFGKKLSADENDWRVEKVANDEHSDYPDYGIWSTTRNLIKFDEVRIRERYTVATNAAVDKQEIVEMLVDGSADADMVIATATVYALNKSVQKPAHNIGEPTDWSRFPALYELTQNNR